MADIPVPYENPYFDLFGDPYSPYPRPYRRPRARLPNQITTSARRNIPLRTAPAGGGWTPGAIANAIGRFGGVAITAADILARMAEEYSQQKLDEKYEEAEFIYRDKLRRRAREKELRAVVVRDDLGRLPAEQHDRSPGKVQSLQLPAQETTAPIRTSDSASIQLDDPFGGIDPGQLAKPDVYGPPTPQVDGAGQVAEFPGLGAEIGPVSAPGAEISAEIAQEIAQGAAPQRVFGQPSPPPPLLKPQPVTDPIFDPLVWGTPELTAPQARPLSFVQNPDPTGEILQFPQPQPQPQTDPRRCKPCKEDNPEPRNRCFKGLYRERRLDTQVDYTEWAEIDCETGVEI